MLDILGEHAFQMQGNRCDDLLDIELLEEIAWHIGERFSQCINLAPDNRPTSSQTANNHRDKNSAQIISLPDAKIRRANQRF